MLKPLPEETSSPSLVPLLREFMKEAGVTQRDLAAAIGMKSNQLNVFFTEKSDMHSRKLVLLLRTLGIDLEQILADRLAEIRNHRADRDSTALLTKINAMEPLRRKPLLAIVKMLAN